MKYLTLLLSGAVLLAHFTSVPNSFGGAAIGSQAAGGGAARPDQRAFPEAERDHAPPQLQLEYHEKRYFMPDAQQRCLSLQLATITQGNPTRTIACGTVEQLLWAFLNPDYFRENPEEPLPQQRQALLALLTADDQQELRIARQLFERCQRENEPTTKTTVVPTGKGVSVSPALKQDPDHNAYHQFSISSNLRPTAPVYFFQIQAFMDALNRHIRREPRDGGGGYLLSSAYFPQQAIDRHAADIRIGFIDGHLGSLTMDLKLHQPGSDHTTACTAATHGAQPQGKPRDQASGTAGAGSGERPAPRLAAIGLETMTPEQGAGAAPATLADTLCQRNRDLVEKRFSGILQGGNDPASVAPLTLSELQQTVRWANRLPGHDWQVMISPFKQLADGKNQETGSKPSRETVLRPMGESAGAHITLHGQYHPVELYAGMDNYGSEYIGPETGYGLLRLNSPLGLGEQADILISTAPSGGESHFQEYTLTLPLLASDTFMTLDYFKSHSQPGFLLEPYEVYNESAGWSLAVGTPLIDDHQMEVTLSGGYARARYNVDILDRPYFQDEVRKAFVTLDYHPFAKRVPYKEYHPRLMPPGLPIDHEAFVTLRYSRGLKWDGSAGRDPKYASRIEAGPEFNKLELDMNYRAAVKRPYIPPGETGTNWLVALIDGLYGERLERTTRLYFSTRVSGQLSDTPLLSAEEFSVGGKRFGRGYPPGELQGDIGFGASLELGLQLPLSNATAGLIPQSLAHNQMKGADATVYGFLDTGHVWQLDIAERRDRTDYDHIVSAGGGVRIDTGIGLSLRLEMGQPLDRTTQDNDYRPPEIYFGLNMKLAPEGIGQALGKWFSNSDPGGTHGQQ